MVLTPGQTQSTLSVHVGTWSPRWWDEQEARQQEAHETLRLQNADQSQEAVAQALEDYARRLGARSVRPALADPAVCDWEPWRLRPRWVEDEASVCVAALQPSELATQGGTEYSRYLEGAARRDEIALIVAAIGSLESETTSELTVHNLFGESAAVPVPPGGAGTVGGAKLGRGMGLRLAEGLSGADFDLARRLSRRDPDLPLYDLSLSGFEGYRGVGMRAAATPPTGELVPLLVSEVGDTVAGVWVADDGRCRMYVLPVGFDWAAVASWLRDQAIPEYVPDALRRVRDAGLLARDFPTVAETQASQQLVHLDESYLNGRARAESALADARAAADGVRYDLLFARGTVLEHAVRDVLRTAGVHVTSLDEVLGMQSADLLCEWRGRRRLIEVKGAGGRANEDFYGDLIGHLREWPIHAMAPVEGGVLVVNSQANIYPPERANLVYERKAFVQALEHPVVSTRDMLSAWRTGNYAELVKLIFPGAGPPQHQDESGPNPTEFLVATGGDCPPTSDDARYHWIFRRRRRR